jgi:hypothetical protein
MPHGGAALYVTDIAKNSACHSAMIKNLMNGKDKSYSVYSCLLLWHEGKLV